MSTVPRLTYRYAHSVELIIQSTPDVQAYRVGAANSLDTAFAGATPMFTVQRDGTYRSPGIRKKRLGTSLYTTRKITAAMYDPEEFWVGGGDLPHDYEASYVRVEEQNMAGGWRPAGPILIVPPPGFFVTTRPSLVISGTAPNLAASTTGIPPVGAMHVALPRFSDSAAITNNGGASLFVSFGAGMPEFQVLDGTTTYLPDAAVSDVFLRGDGADVAFSISFAVVNAEMA